MDLRALVKSRVMTTIKTVEGKKALLFDLYCKTIIESATSIFDIMEEGVLLADLIDKKRPPNPTLDAIYIIEPNDDNIRLVNRDFADPDVPLYRNIHIFFCRSYPDGFDIKLNKYTLGTRIKTQKVINIDFFTAESRIFHCNSLPQLSILTNPYTTQDLKFQAAAQISSYFISLGDYPVIRYPKSSDILKELSTLIFDILNKHMSQYPDEYPSHTLSPPVLFLLDRTIDPMAPFLHEFTYQAMVHDLLPIQNNKYKYEFTDNEGKKQEKESELNESDPVWYITRHLHIKNASSKITSEFNDFLSKNAGIAQIDRKEKGVALRDMNKALKSIPTYQDNKEIYSTHTRMANECMDQFTSRKLGQIGLVEQDIACGVNPDGEHVPRKKIKLKSKPFWDDVEVKDEDRLRLLVLTCLSFDLTEAELQKLFGRSKLSEELQFVAYNLVKLKSEEVVNERKRRKNVEVPKLEDRPFDLSRYVPRIKKYVIDLIDGNLSESEFPLLTSNKVEKSTTIVRSKKDYSRSLKTRQQPSWKAKIGKDSKFKKAAGGGGITLFVLGGITYSEMRAIYEVGEETKNCVVLGGSSILTPKKMLEAGKRFLGDPK